jgi:uncharacterized protein
MKAISMLVTLLLLAIPSTAIGQDLGGDWQATLHAGAADLHLMLHITRNESGALKATLDSVDQAAYGIPVSSISFENSELSLAVNAVHGTYQGKLSSDGSTLIGTWSQGHALPLEFKRATAPVSEHKLAKPSDIDGTWMGTLDTGTIKLRVVFHIVTTDAGLVSTLDSPDQNTNGVPTAKTTRDGPAMAIEVPAVGGVFEGKIAPDLSAINGTWKQGGTSLPLALHRVKDKAELERKRPQNPTKPYPYRNEEVSYENTVQAVTLAATLTIPQGKGPFPAVVLITGSGPQDRDESLMGHKPFLVLSDYLTRKGIAVLRADDRGTEKSTGDFSTATTADFATDTEAGVAYLKARPEINPHKIGLIGHSEGGDIAPMVAARNPDIAFIVMMAGSGVPGDQVLPAQMEAIEEASGKSHEEAEQDAAQERELIQLAETEKDPAVLDKQLRQKLMGSMPEAQIGAQIRVLTSPWFRFFMTYDPAAALRKVSCPVLAINGEKDKQVLPDQNLPPIRKALEQGGNKRFEVEELLGLNHLFQTAETGAPGEYAEIEETISPVALNKITNWILQQ